MGMPVRALRRASKFNKLWFFAATLIGAVAPLVVIPVSVQVGGVAGFTDLAIGMALGSTAGIVSTLGWGVTGPTDVARGKPAQVQHLYSIAVWARAAAALAVGALAAFIAYILSTSFGASAAAYAFAGACQGMSANWYYTGRNQPVRLALCDALPRLLATCSGCLLAWTTGSLMWVGLALVVGELFISFAGARLAHVNLTSLRLARPDVVPTVRKQLPLTGSQLVGQSANRLSLPLLQWAGMALPQLAIFAAGARLTMLARTGFRPVLNIFQAWVARGEGTSGRGRRATHVTLGIGVAGATLAFVLLPVLGPLIFKDAVDFTWHITLPVAVFICGLAASYSSSLYFLVPADRTDLVAATEFWSALMGLGLIGVGAHIGGGFAALVGLAVAQVWLAVTQWWFVLRKGLWQPKAGQEVAPA